ncbi:hypothetical protein Pfo_021284 [Paulownia fortunei]|nr:hypothetical protein Pfo_021284 [Paulownia fortunei]
MGERRKRKSLWDMEEETKHLSGMSEHNPWTVKDRHSSHGSGRYHEVSESRTTISRKSRDHSGWPPWESIEEHPIAPTNSSFKNAPEGKESGGGKRYYKNMSPGFDGMELRNYDYTHEYDRSHSQRYLGRGRSRSRSKSRTRDRSRSRSLSRGRERERRRGWSRSRSRSRSDANAKDHTRSRSPIGDYRRQSYGRSDRRSGPEKSSQICRDFTAGTCRRGSQCRFFHPNTINRRDGDLVEDDTAESWRSRADHSRIPKHSHSRASGFESRNDVSDPYHGEDEQFLNKPRSAVPCKDFMRGKCRWGDTCRFFHHAASGDSFGQGTRNASFDKDIDRQPYKNGKPFCKYFAAGKCDRENCRFSHEDPINVEGRRGEVTDSRSHDKSNWWNGPTWDDATRISDTLKPTGWSETIVTNTTSTGDAGNGQNDDRGGHSLENENKNWGILECTLPGKSDSYGGDTGPTESIAKDNTANKQEHLIFHGSQLQNQDGLANVRGQNALQEHQSLSIKALQQNVYPASSIQEQHCRVIDNNQMNSFGSDVLDEVKDTRFTAHPIIFSGKSLNQNGGSMFPEHSSISNERDRGQNMLCPNPSNGFSTDLNGPETHTVGPLNVQTHMQNIQKAVQSAGFLEAKVPQLLANLLTTKHSDQVTNSPVTTAGQQVPPVTNPVSLTQSFMNEHSQTYAGIEVSNARGMMPSFSDTSGWVPLVNTIHVQPNPVAVSLDLFNSMGNGRDNAEHGNHNLAQGTEQNSQMQLKRSSPLSVVGTEFESSKVKHPESPRLGQEEVVANSEVTGGNKAIGEEIRGVQENKRSETLDGHEKVEEESANKDEKGMRVFKNALVEFVKEILKPTWKEGRMSREVHKTVVKKVVDKVASTIQVDQIPKTQDKVEQYLSYSKPKITKLVQAYVERCLKIDS